MYKGNEPQIIIPTALYTPNSLASALQVDEKWVKRNLIYNRACRYRKEGAVYVILGKWVIEWAEADHELPRDEEPS